MSTVPAFPRRTARRSLAALGCGGSPGPLCNVVRYASILENVAPLEEESAGLQKDLQASQTKLAHLQDDLSSIDDAVAKLKKQFETSTQEGARLRMELEEAQLTIASAEGLIGKLDGERSRWGSQVCLPLSRGLSLCH
jgi:chromosome segregation ATPase